MSFSCQKGEFDPFFNRLDRPVEESRPDRFLSLVCIAEEHQLKKRQIDSSCFVAAGLVVDLATYLPVEVVMISQESTTKDVKLVGLGKIDVHEFYFRIHAAKSFKVRKTRTSEEP